MPAFRQMTRNLDLQRDALRKAGAASIFRGSGEWQDCCSTELDHCLKALRAGDTLVVWRLDRLGRSLPDLVQIVAGLEKNGIGFESITEKIETTSAAGELVFHVFGGVGRVRAQPNSGANTSWLGRCTGTCRSGGRKPKLNAPQIREIKRLMSDPTISAGQIAERYKVSRTTMYKVPSRNAGSAADPRLDVSKKMSHRQVAA